MTRNRNPGKGAAAARPNVLLITVDHWPGTHAPFGDGELPWAPTLRQLARLGTVFPRAYSACPICIPARRALMTGLSARSHGDRNFNEFLEMPDAPILPGCFRAAGYQTAAVGKLHVYPRRARIGFDQVILNEEGRRHIDGRADDWEQALADGGYGGLEYAAGAGNNDYVVQPWHLPDSLHPSNWAAREICRVVSRRDPSVPGFWYLSFVGPHPPIWPLASYLEQMRDVPDAGPDFGGWLEGMKPEPFKWTVYSGGSAMRAGATREEIQLARRAFFALQTHIDHQIRVVLGTLREEGILDNTIVVFTSDHGDMLGTHGLWGKSVMYEDSCRVPLVVVPPANVSDARRDARDNRLCELADIMPTVLNLAGLQVPGTVEGLDLFQSREREFLYGEQGEGTRATRMLLKYPFKLIYYPEGNRFQLFNLDDDPRELVDLANDPAKQAEFSCLRNMLREQLYGEDLDWVEGEQWKGLPMERGSACNWTLSGQRGLRFL